MWKKYCFVLCFVIIVIAPSIAPFVGFAGKSINCKYQDIDANTGFVRHTKMIYGIPISRKYEPTALSQTLGFDKSELNGGNWLRVNAFSPGISHSPHFNFHHALSQIKKLEIVWESENFDTESRQNSAREVLRLWSVSHSDSAAANYISHLTK
jgi:hypothetical protein